MAPPVGTLRVGRYFLALILALGLLYTMVFWPGARHTPKLGLDLVGGTQVIFTAKTTGTGKTPSKSSMNQAKQIMENRVNGSGVTEATVVIQGSDQIVISIPGNTNTDVAKLGRAAVLSFRSVVMPAVPVLHPVTGASAPSTAPATPTATPTGSGTPKPTTSAPRAGTGSATQSAKNLLEPDTAGRHRLAAPQAAPATTPKPTPSASGTPTVAGSPTPSAAQSVPPATAQPFAALKFAIPTSETDYDKLQPTQQQQLQAALSTFDCRAAQDELDKPESYFIGCQQGQLAFLLGKVIVPGHEISGASAQAPNVSQGQVEWSVSLSLKSTGSRNWSKYTGAHNIGGSSTQPASVSQCGATGTPCADFVAFTLDGNIISAPVNNDPIPEGSKTQITGNFKQKTAKELADQLKYGALPLSFKAEDAQTVSATLGTSQLKAGLLAGGIGLILVVFYSLIYYRALGLVTIASLLVSGGLTYAALVILGTQIGFTLSLAGIAGFIVAVGITADSFVVFFERMKDEVHEGRSARVAIPRAWIRARRTILSADTVSFLAAATLYYFAAGDVKGFAFTLGLSTVLDLVVVFLFTHPLVSWLSRKKAFGSSRFTGLNAMREGGIAAPAPDHAPRQRTRPVRARTAPATATGQAPVAVLEREERAARDLEAFDDVDTDELGETATVPDAPDEEFADAADETDPATGDEIDTDVAAAAKARRRTTPEPGSAAERAAQRRAKMRADEKGTS
ncbi:MAG: protein translocase subunit SecD [Actinomycetota bacterium]|nr:protein translocase subunit SecD [Actinomycetota bacterium]